MAAAGRRAANWLRSLDGLVGNWVSGALADAVEEATGCLDPADRDDADRWGQGGVPKELRDRLDVVLWLPAIRWLPVQQQVAVVTVAACVRGMPELLANDPDTVITEGELGVLCVVMDGAMRTADNA